MNDDRERQPKLRRQAPSSSGRNVGAEGTAAKPVKKPVARGDASPRGEGRRIAPARREMPAERQSARREVPAERQSARRERPVEKQVARRETPSERHPSRRDAEYLYPDRTRYPEEIRGERASLKRKVAPSRKRATGGKKKRANPFTILFYSAFALIVALLMAFLLRTFVVEVIRVQGDAMTDTLQDGDWVLVTKFDYWSGAPRRGDIVSINLEGKDGVIFRRVVGEPENTVEITDGGDTLINGQTISEPYVSKTRQEAYRQITLQRSRYFVLSDNRDIRTDSRDTSVGVVTKSQLSRARAIIWPLGRWETDLGYDSERDETENSLG